MLQTVWYWEESGNSKCKCDTTSYLFYNEMGKAMEPKSSNTGGGGTARKYNAKKFLLNQFEFPNNLWQIVLQEKRLLRRGTYANYWSNPLKWTRWFPGNYLEVNRYRNSQWWEPEISVNVSCQIYNQVKNMTNIYTGGTTINDQEFVMSQEFVIVDFLSHTQSLLLQIFYINS